MVSSIIAKIVGFILLPIYTAKLSPTEYGIIDLLTLIGVLINGVISIQITQGMARYISDKSTSFDEVKKYASTSFYFVLFANLGVLILGAIFSGFLSEQLIAPKTTELFLCFLATIFIGNLLSFFDVYYRYLRKVLFFSIANLIYSLLNIAAIFYLIVALDFGVFGVYIGSIASGMAFLFYYVFKERKVVFGSFEREKLKKMTSYSLPLVPAAIASVGLMLSDRWFIKEYLSFDSLGVYGVGAKFASVITIVASAFSFAITPIVYNSYNEKTFGKDMSLIFKMFVYLGTFCFFVLSFFSKETLLVMVDEKFQHAYYIMPIFYYTIGMSSLLIFGPGLRVKFKTKILSYINVGAVLLNIGLNFLLVPMFQEFGAAISTIIAVTLNSIIVFVYSQRILPYKHQMPVYFLLFGVQMVIVYLDIYVFNLDLLPKVMFTMVYLTILLLVFGKKIKTKILKR